MEHRVYQVSFAGRGIPVQFRNPETKPYFGRYLSRSEASAPDVLVSEGDMERMRRLLAEDMPESYVEYRALPELISESLLKDRCCILHGVAFSWLGRAYILTAPSGTGKTTQYLNWARLFPGEIEMICGDMPVLEAREDGSVWVHPTSWNGKENIRGGAAAPLAGIVILRQGQENTIERVSPRDAIQPILMQFVVRLETREQILSLAGLMDQALGSVPLFLFTNMGNDASTMLLRQSLASETKDGQRDGRM